METKYFGKKRGYTELIIINPCLQITIFSQSYLLNDGKWWNIEKCN